MRFLPKAHFRWQEPKLFLRLNDAFEHSKLRWWHKPLWTLIGAALVMSNWFIARLNPSKEPPPLIAAVLVAIAGGAFFAYVVPWMISLCPSEVRFYDSYITCVRGNTHRQIKYAEILSFSWRARSEFATLILRHSKHKQEILLGVPPEISQASITQFLLDHGIQANSQSG